MERCRCSKEVVMMQLITQRCSMSVQLSTLDRTVQPYYNKKYKEASVRKRYYECTISTTQSTRKYHSSENDTRRHLRIITKTNTKKKAKNSNEKDYTHTKLTRTRTKSISPSYWWSQVLDSNKQKNDRPRSGAGPDNARYLNSSPWANP